MEADAPARLEDHLGYWLRRVSHRVSDAFARALAAHDVSVAEWVVLRLVYGAPEGIPAVRLAERMGMTRGALSKVVAKLEAKGWMIRSPDPADSRAALLALTQKGRRLLPHLAALADQNDAHFFGCLSPEEQRRLLALLRKITETHGWKESPVD